MEKKEALDKVSELYGNAIKRLGSTEPTSMDALATELFEQIANCKYVPDIHSALKRAFQAGEESGRLALLKELKARTQEKQARMVQVTAKDAIKALTPKDTDML